LGAITFVVSSSESFMIFQNRFVAAVLGLSLLGMSQRLVLPAEDKSPTEKKPVEKKAEEKKSEEKKTEVKKADEKKADATSKLREIKLFNGKNLDGWKSSEFGGDGEITIEDGTLILDMGNDLTGVAWKEGKVLPKFNYEITLDAQRVDGSDFFCGLTFPIKDDPCSLILGGWGGTVCGLSSLNFRDASENETTTFRDFKNRQWYKIRLRVLEKKITAWVDDKEILDVDLTDLKIGIRGEVELSKPLGFCSYRTKAALKNIVLKEIEASKP
jgi:hypothetical protein